MRRIAAELERLEPKRFILLIGLVAGAIQGVPRFIVGGASTARAPLAPFAIVGVAAVVRWIAAVLLWWIAVRRRQSSTWAIAGQVTLGLFIAELFAAALAVVNASIVTQGEFVAVVVHNLPLFVMSNFGLALLRSPFWYVGAVLTIGFGRHLAAVSRSVSAPARPLRSGRVADQ